MRFHRIAPLAHVALRDVRPDLAALLREDRDRALMHHVRVTASLAAIRSTLTDIPWVTFKGPVLSELRHPVAGLRSYGDLDVLVDPMDLREASERLLGTGWRNLATRDDLLNGEVTGEWSWVAPVARSSTCTGRWCSPRPCVAGSTSRPPSCSPAAVLSPSGRSRCAPSTSLTRWSTCATTPRSPAPSGWSTCSTSTRRQPGSRAGTRLPSGLGPGAPAAQVGLVLARARRVLGTPVPEDLDGQLGLSRAFGTLVSGGGPRPPIPAVRTDASWPRLVARAARPSVLATVATTLRTAVLGAVNRGRPTPAPEQLSPAGRDDVEAWFSAVEAVSDSATAPLATRGEVLPSRQEVRL